MCKALTTILILSNILLDFLVQTIIVESNLHTYYRLPTTTVKTTNDSENYYILQCPFKSSMNIPKPQDMPICLIVGRHSEIEHKQKELVKPKSRSTLNTQVDFRHLKPLNLVKLVKIKNGKPYTLIMKPVNTKKVAHKIPKTPIKEKYKVPSVKFVLTNPKAFHNQSTVLYTVPLVEKIQMNDSLASTSIIEPQKLTPARRPITTVKTDLLDDPLDEQDTQPSPLKYLGVRDTLKKLQLRKQPPHALAANQTQQYESEKFFVDLENHKKGFRTKGFQNMYHRDEIYHDHIFYDDLQQEGNYQIKQKEHKLQP